MRKHGKIILKIHVRNMNHDPLVLSRPDLWMIWRCHVIPRVYCYYFCLEPTVKKDTWMRTTSVPVMAIFFESGILKVTWSQLSSPSLLNKHEVHWQQRFERYPTFFYFTDKDQYPYDFGKRHWNENRWRCLEKDSCAKACTWKTLHQNRNHVSLILCASFPHKPSFKFNVVLIGICFW